MPDGRSVRVSMSRRQLGQMLIAGALRGIPPAGVLSVDDADRLTQASPIPAGSISRSSSTSGDSPRTSYGRVGTRCVAVAHPPS
jgi:hypothetical protein